MAAATMTWTGLVMPVLEDHTRLVVVAGRLARRRRVLSLLLVATPILSLALDGAWAMWAAALGVALMAILSIPPRLHTLARVTAAADRLSSVAAGLDRLIRAGAGEDEITTARRGWLAVAAANPEALMLDKAGKAKAASMARHHAMWHYPGMYDGASWTYINRWEGPTPDKENKQWPRNSQ